MTSDRWLRFSELIDGALSQPTVSRAQWLQTQTVGEPELYQEVQRILSEEDVFTPIQSAVQAASDAVEAEEELQPGYRIGVYRIVKPLGRGGMGVVYEAVRCDEQFSQSVAIKLISRAAQSSQLATRFRSERKLLAALDHPGIARILDGGTTLDGRPYLVMELVSGRPLMRYCLEEQLPIRTLLTLFVEVCAAVQHAHGRMIIHRDIKPGNILVTADGGPKLLDFGIAKAIDDLAEENLTLTGAQLMTPEYASPEQVRGEPSTAATDVYSLGALLFEMLTREKANRFRNKSPLEVARVICEAETRRPSLAAPKWKRQLTGDLDNIVLMAMRKEPARRYQSVRQFAEDIERYLGNQPVIARPLTLPYRSGKFLRRYWLTVSAAAALLLSLVGGVIASQYQARLAQRRFEQVRRLSNSFVFAVDDAIRDLSGSTTARELIVKTGLEYLDSLALDAGGDLELKLELAGAYEKVADVLGNPSIPNLGHTAAALQNYTKAQRLTNEVLARNSTKPAALRQLAQVALKAGDLQLVSQQQSQARESFKTAQQAVQKLRHQGASDAAIEFIDGGCWLRTGDQLAEVDLPAAIETFQRAYISYRKANLLQPSPRFLRAIGISKGRIGRMLVTYGNPRAALPNLQEAVSIAAGLASSEPLNQAMCRRLANAIVDLGDAEGLPSYFNLGEPMEALQNYRRAEEMQRLLLEQDGKSVLASTDLLFTHNRIAAVLLSTSPAQAIKVLEETLRSLARLGDAAQRPDVRAGLELAHQRLASAHLARHELDAGMREAQAALAFYDHAEPDPGLLIVLGDLQNASGRHSDAIASWNKGVQHAHPDDLASRPGSLIRDVAQLLERLAGTSDQPCTRYQQALQLWDICRGRGAPVEKDRGALLAKMKNCPVSGTSQKLASALNMGH